jgi:hypothetical protein
VKPDPDPHPHQSEK